MIIIGVKPDLSRLQSNKLWRRIELNQKEANQHMNLLFEYLYRDAGNYKNWGEVIFSNANQIEVGLLEKKIREFLFDSEFFVVEGLSMPTLYFENFDRDLDHGWHEFGAITPCEKKLLIREIGIFRT